MTARRATQHSFSETPPEVIYWDSNFLLSSLLSDDTNHMRCLNFCLSIQSASTRVVYSQATLIESIIKCHRAAKEGHLPSPQRLLPLGTDFLFSYCIAEWQRTLRSFLRQFRDCWEVNITKSVMKRVFPLIRQYHLDVFDALHIATMQHVGCNHIACLDEHFLRISNLHVWNGLIFAPLKPRRKGRNAI